MKPLIVTGTDTGVGKTAVAAMLTLALDAKYWKPIQAGTQDGTDTQRARAMTGLSASRFLPERYVLREPLSPHRAAELDGVGIDLGHLGLPDGAPGSRLIIEGAGGVLVPLTRDHVQSDLFARWGAPVVLVARTSLGTINHTLLSLEALRHRSVPVLGVVFVGDPMEDSERTIAEMAKVKRLGRLPFLPVLDARSLRDVFCAHFRLGDFEAVHG